MNQRLQELTDLTLKEILNLEIVLPEIYRDIFYTKAKELGIKLNDIDKETALIYALKKIQHVENETKKSTSFLKENVMNARMALTNHDDMALQFIENNMIELENKIASLQQELYLDELTRLFNRRWLFEAYLSDEHFNTAGVLAFIDINDFKDVNDNYGHIVGDKVLHIMGKVLKKIVHSTAVRFAGDEFLILSNHHTREEMEKILSAVNQNLRKTPFKHNETQFYLDFSFGVTCFSAKQSFRMALEQADQNMYNYKKSLK